MNEKGASLLVVLITVSIFMILGISILTVALGGALRTQIQLDRYENVYSGKEQLDYVTTQFKEKVTTIELDTAALKNGSYQGELDTLLGELNKLTDFHGEDITKNYITDYNDLFTRIYRFSITSGDDTSRKVISKRIIISPAPSFLDYSLGSFGKGKNDGQLHINGSPNVDGDIIANDFFVKNQADFIDASGNSTSKTPFLAVDGNINVLHTLSLWDISTGGPIEINSATLEQDQVLPSFFYLDRKPDVFSREVDFSEVNFDQTYLDKINELLLGTEYANPLIVEDDLTTDNRQDSSTKVMKKVVETLTQQPNKEQLNLLDDNLLLDDSVINQSPKFIFHENLEINSSLKPLKLNRKMVIAGDLSLTTGANNSIEINEDMTVLGDLIINSNNTPINIKGTVVVHGDIIIEGNEESIGASENDTVKFDATIYSYGESMISNTNILGIEDDKQLVLFSKGTLTITRINEFTPFSFELENQNIYDMTNESVPPLKAFFYTDDSAVLYGVGSRFHINGGVFAKKNLEINAIRGNIRPSTFNLEPSISVDQNNKKTRFQVVHDPNVLVSQVSRLPVADRLRVIVDDAEIN